MQLTDSQKSQIRMMAGSDRQIAAQFGVKPSTIYSIRHRNNGAVAVHNGNGKLTTEVTQPRATILGLQLDPKMEFKDWAAVFYDAALRWEQSNWVLADALNHPHADSDEGQQLIAEVMKRPRFARLKPGTLNNIKSIGKQYSFDERMTMLSWSHHAAVAYIEDHSARAELLKEADQKDLGVRELEEKIGKSKRKRPEPEVTIEVNWETAPKWRRDLRALLRDLVVVVEATDLYDKKACQAALDEFMNSYAGDTL